MIVIVDYGLGNLRSVEKAFERIGQKVTISSDISIIKKAKKLILPGVGHFAKGMDKLRERGLIDILNEKVMSFHTPILGICLGMQLFTKFSEEGNCKGLGWIDAETHLMKFNTNLLKIPHVGWNNISPQKKHLLFENIDTTDQFYFVHSYYVKCNKDENSLARTIYGIDFDSVIINHNIIGVQFHPEKSHKPGLNILKNFLTI